MTTVEKLQAYRNAGYPCVQVLTHEENRFMQELLVSVNTAEVNLISWDCQYAFRLLKQAGTEALPPFPDAVKGIVSSSAIEFIQNYKVPSCIFVMKDFHLHFTKVETVRLLRNLWKLLSTRGSILVFLGHKFSVPAEIIKDVQLLDYDLPDAAALKARLNYVIDSVNSSRRQAKCEELPAISKEIEEQAIEAAKGMTSTEAENAFSMSISVAKKYNEVFVTSVFQEKIQQLKKNGLLTYIENDATFDNIGGLQGIKRWISGRAKAYSQAARDYKLPLPKGILIASVPGSGKTLLAKGIASALGCPLFLWNIDKMFGSLVGDTERNLHEAIKTIESIGKCVILLDEIEKSLNHAAVSGQGDTGTSSRMFGALLTWLNDRKNPAFIVATTNNFTILPSALIRKGRFDQLFWADLPSPAERKEIFQVVIKKFGRNPDDFSLPTLVGGSDSFTGAEIDQVFQDAMYDAFKNDEEVNDQHVMAAIPRLIPFAHSHAHELAVMREQAAGKLTLVSEQGDVVVSEQEMTRRINMQLS